MSAISIRALAEPTGDVDLLKLAFGRFPSGVAALCAEVDGEPVGLVASSFTVGVSMSPPLVLFSVQNSSRTWPLLQRASRIGVSILGSKHAAACAQLASKQGDRFAGLKLDTTSDGSIFIHEAPVWLDCTVLSETPAGDHHVVLLEVARVSVEQELAPLVYHSSRFHQLQDIA